MVRFERPPSPPNVLFFSGEEKCSHFFFARQGRLGILRMLQNEHVFAKIYGLHAFRTGTSDVFVKRSCPVSAACTAGLPGVRVRRRSVGDGRAPEAEVEDISPAQTLDGPYRNRLFANKYSFCSIF